VIVDRNGGAPRAAISPQHIKLERVLLVNDILGFKRAATGQSNAKGIALALRLPLASTSPGHENGA